MGIVLSSNFDVQTGLPLDSRAIVADTTARDAIPALVRYIGMAVHCLSDSKNYQLVGGIDNADWEEFAGAGGGGFRAKSSQLTLTASGTITIDTAADAPDESIRIQSSSGAITLSNTPFGTTAPRDGKLITLLGNSNTEVVQIPANDAAKGAMNYSVALGRFESVTYEYDATVDRYLIVAYSN